MPMMPPTFRTSRAPTQADRQRQSDQRRGKTSDRGYGWPWQKARDGHLRNNPLCFYCEMGAWGEPPRVTAATAVDHFYPHNGDKVVFWLRAFWKSCCEDCHNGPKQVVERRGRAALADLAQRLGVGADPRG